MSSAGPRRLTISEVRLRALEPGDALALATLVASGDNEGAPCRPVQGECRRFVRSALCQERDRRGFHFLLLARDTSRGPVSTTQAVPAGWMALFELDWDARTAEAGTWIAPSWRGLGINPRAKGLLLDHAFAVLGLSRVRFLVEAENTPSIRALRRLGAVEDPSLAACRAPLPFSVWRDDDQLA